MKRIGKKLKKAAVVSMAAAMVLQTTAFAAPMDDLNDILERQAEQEQDTLMEDTIGFEKIGEMMDDNGLQLSLNLGLTDGTAEILELPEEYAKGASVSLNTQIDPNEKKWLLELGGALTDSGALELSLYGDEQELAVSIPQFYAGALAIRAGSLAQQYTGSALSQLLGELPEEFSDFDLNFYPDLDDMAEEYNFAGDLEQVLEADAEKLENSMTAQVQEGEAGQVYTVTCETAGVFDLYRDVFSEYLKMFSSLEVITAGEFLDAQNEIEEVIDALELGMDDEINMDFYVENDLVTRISFGIAIDAGQLNSAMETGSYSTDAEAAAVEEILSGETETVASADVTETEAAEGSADATETEAAEGSADVAETEAAEGSADVAETELEEVLADAVMAESEIINVQYDIVYRDPANSAAGIDFSMVMTPDGGEEESSMSMSMESVATDTTCESTIYITMKDQDEVLYDGQFMREFFDASTGEYDISVTMEDEDTSVAFILDSMFTEIEKGKSFTLAINELSMEVDGESIGLNGELYVSGDPGEITTPQETRMVLELDEETLNSLLMEVQLGAINWMSQFVPETESMEGNVTADEGMESELPAEKAGGDVVA